MNEPAEVSSVPTAVTDNPFRILGLPVNSSEREIHKQIRTLTRYAEVGRSRESKFDLPALGTVDRSLEAIKKAASQIERDEDRVKHSLFWFSNKNPVDETALDHLARGGNEKARAIWKKIPQTGHVSERNVSAIVNIGTLELIDAFHDSEDPHFRSQREDRFSAALQGMGMLLGSASFQTLTHLTVGKSARVDSEAVIHSWAQTIVTEGVRAELSPDVATLFQAFNNCPAEVVEIVEDYIVAEPRQAIENAVRLCEERRESTPAEAQNAAHMLYATVEGHIQTLQGVLGADNLNFQLLSDSVSEELVASGRAYFHANKDAETDPGTDTRRVLDMALKCAASQTMKHGVQKDLDGVRGWLEGKETRDRLRSVEQPIAVIQAQLDAFSPTTQTQLRSASGQIRGVQEANGLLGICSPELKNIRTALGPTDEHYLGWSGAVAQCAINRVVACVNVYQKFVFTSGRPSDHLDDLRDLLRASSKIFDRVLTYDLSPDARRYVSANHQKLVDLKGALPSPSSGSGCFIATMAYGDIDHPDVISLRRFRDRYLLPFRFGRLFVSWYYRHSRGWVARWEHVSVVRKGLRKALQLLVGVLPK